jgi:glucose uptake protein
MILPHTYGTLILLMVLSLVCWGSWPNLFKLAKKCRFELFYFDFAIGLMVTALICAFTFGSLGFDGFNFTDDLMNASKRMWMYGFLASLLFNFANMLLLASISVSGIAVAFPVGFGAAMVVTALLNYLSVPQISGPLLLVGCVLMAGSLVLNASAFNRLNVLRHEVLARGGTAKSTRRPTSIKAVVLALVAGLIMGSFAPLLSKAQNPDLGVGPYSLAVIFGGAALCSTFMFNLFFMNLPVEGEPLEITVYFKNSIKQHFLGFLAGAIWMVGIIATFVVATPKGDSHLGPPENGLLGQAAPLLAAVWGLVVWKEFKDGDLRVKGLGVAMLILFAGGLAMMAIAPMYGPRP